VTNALTAAGDLAPPLTVAAFVTRDRARDIVHRAFPRRKAHVINCRTAAEVREVFSRELVDAAVVDLGTPTEETWRAAGLARHFPCAGFIGLTPMRAADGPSVARCAELEFADLCADGIDDSGLGPQIHAAAFTTRFVRALEPAAESLGLNSVAQRRAWRAVVSYGGRPVRTVRLAATLRVTREHLSRTFATAGAPNLKRVIDLVRLIAASELAKCSGYDLADVARVLQFASLSHLTTTAQRVCGARAASLARLRAGDILERFREGRGRSRK